jgi:gliding motility-associated-like protein
VSPLVTTTYSDTVKSRSGCDSLIRKTVVNVGVPTVLPSLNTTICRGQSYTLPSGLRVSPLITTTFGDTVRSRNGCDSLIRSINITVNQPTARPLSISICSGQNYTLSNGRIVTASGVYQDTSRSIIGCDSIITTTTLTVTPPIETATAVAICSGQTHRLQNGRIVSIAGVYRDTLKNAQGCNSVIVTTLTVNNITTSRNKTIFEGQFDTLPKGKVVNTEGVYRDSFKTKNGCDSVVITTLTVKKVVIDESCFEALKKTLPDAFSPNDDGVNDKFDPEKYFIPSGCPTSLHAEQLQIVSRWGEVIFKAKPYEAWDGTSQNYKNPVVTGAYYYVLVFNIDGKEKIIRGVINCFSR